MFWGARLKNSRGRYFFFVFFVGLAVFFENACGQLSRISPDQALEINKIAGPPDQNGRSYDGLSTMYISRNFLRCSDANVPDVSILQLTSNVQSDNQFQITKRVQTDVNQCSENTLTTTEVAAFEASQLAAYEGNLNDKVLNVGEISLDNSKTQIVCKLNGGPLLFSHGMLGGVVVKSTGSPQVQASRLDFTQLPNETVIPVQLPPDGSLYQTPTSLEFRSAPVISKPGFVQLMYIKVDYTPDTNFVPSTSYGQKVFTGSFQYFYVDYTQTPNDSMSINLPLTCYVGDLSADVINTDAVGGYDFLSALIQLYSNK